MKVYIAEACGDYNTSYIFGVYATKELARQAWDAYVTETRAQYEPDQICPIDCEFILISEHEVKEEEVCANGADVPSDRRE